MDVDNRPPRMNGVHVYESHGMLGCELLKSIESPRFELEVTARPYKYITRNVSIFNPPIFNVFVLYIVKKISG